MNVKSITDLDDILINETEPYHDDDFDEESPPPKSNVSIQSKKNDAEYDEDVFEADESSSEVHSLEEREEIWEDEIAPQVAPPTPIADTVAAVAVPPSEVIHVPSFAHFTPATPENITSSSSRRAAETIIEAGLTVRNDPQTAWPETQPSNVSSRLILPEPAPPVFTHLRMTGQKGLDCRVSHVHLVSEEERFLLNSGLNMKTNRQKTKSSTTEREDTLRALEEMLLVAAERVEKRVASEQMLSSRSVPIAGGWVVPEIPNTKNPLSFVGENLGIPDYDPDYDVAVEMAQRRLIQPPYHHRSIPKGSHGGQNFAHTTTNSSSSHPNVPSSSNLIGAVTVIRNNNNDSEEFVRTTLAQEERRQRREKETSSVALRNTASFTGSTLDAREMAEKLIDDINDQKVSSELLRLGINRPQLQDQSEAIYSTFLSDIMELCKTRASSSSSIEEIAMHRALATYVHEFFVPAHQIKKARARMVEVAVESSLKYIPVQKNYPLPSTMSLSDHNTNHRTGKGSGGERAQGLHAPSSSSAAAGDRDRGGKIPRATAQRRNKDNHSMTTRSSSVAASSSATTSAYRNTINNTRGLILREERIGGHR